MLRTGSSIPLSLPRFASNALVYPALTYPIVFPVPILLNIRGLDNPLNKNTQLKMKVIEIGENCLIRIEEVATNALFLETCTYCVVFSTLAMDLE